MRDMRWQARHRLLRADDETVTSIINIGGMALELRELVVLVVMGVSVLVLVVVGLAWAMWLLRRRG